MVLARGMKRAKQDPEYAKTLFQTLSKCALDDTSATPARGACAQNTKKLADRYPEMQADFDALLNQLPKKVTRLLRLD